MYAMYVKSIQIKFYPTKTRCIRLKRVLVRFNVGYVLIADEIKEDAQAAIKTMPENGIIQTVMLSGDKDSITQKIAKSLGIDMSSCHSRRICLS